VKGRRLGAFLLVAFLVLSVAGPSQAAISARHWSRLGLSRMGNHWTPNLDKPLFGRNLDLVPGQTEKRTFYVRNQSGEQARLRVSVNITKAHRSLQRDAFRVAARTRAGWWQHVRHTGSHAVLWRTMARGAVIPVTLRVRIRPRADNSSMDRGLRLQVKVRLSQRIR